jgi:hypothetical protein
MHRTTRRRTLLAGILAIALAACGDAEPAAVDAAAEPADDAVAAPEEERSEGAEVVEDLLDAVTDEPERLPFDADAEIHPADIEVRPWGTGEPEQPFEILLLPDDFAVPATARLVTWAPPEQPFDGENRRIGGSGAFHVFEAEPGDVAAFFTDRLPSQGWELEEEAVDGDNWRQVWVTQLAFDDWPEDWMADERAAQVRVRLVYLPNDADPDQATMQFYHDVESVHHRWD